MSKINIDQIEHIAKLSKLKLTEEEKSRFSLDLSNILNYVEQLALVDTENTETTANITGLSNVSRQDEVLASTITHEDIKKNAPIFEENYIVVPGVFE